jgi:hypothetical protein
MKSNVAFNPVLTMTAQKFMQDSTAFVGRRLFPLFFTALQSANYYVFNRENLLNAPTNIRRAPGSHYTRHPMTLTGDSYSCQNYGVEEPVDDEERAKYGSAVDADNAAVRRGVNTILINHELRVRDKIYNASGIPTSTPGATWDDPAATPVQDVRVMKEGIYSNCGMEANVLCMNRNVFNALCDCPQILDRIKYSERGIITEQLLASLFGVAEVLVAGGVVNSAAEGLTLNPSSIWGSTVILAHVESAQDLSAPNFGRTFAWSQFTGPDGLQTFTYRQDEIDSDIHRVRQHCDEKLVGPECGYRLTDVLS